MMFDIFLLNGQLHNFEFKFSGKTYSLMGTEKDPGIIVRVIERLFSITHSKVKIRLDFTGSKLLTK